MESPAGTALVHPRRKAGQAKLGRGTQAVTLTKSDLEKLMHLRLGEASKQLGLCATTVKKVCRTLGIHKWDKASSQDSVESVSSRESFFDNTQAFAWPAHSHISGVASDSGLGISFTASTATAQERPPSTPSSSTLSHISDITSAARIRTDDNSTSTGTSSSSTVDGGRSADPSEALHPAP